jgi:hypothetical protein
MPKNARPTHRQLHVLLGARIECQARPLKQDPTANLKKLLYRVQTLATDKKHNFPRRRIRRNRLKLKKRLCQQNKLDQPARITPTRYFNQRKQADYRNLTQPNLDMATERNLTYENSDLLKPCPGKTK